MTEMLRILPYNSVTFDKGIVIGDAYDVRVTYEINGERRLDFSYPINEKSEIISENKIVVCEGQAYRIIKVSKTIGEKNFITAECSHVYNADASNIHIQNIPDLIGKTPSYVLGQIFKNTKFSIMTDSELTKVGLKRVDYSGFKVDFFSMDKTNPYEAVKALIENCGKGEIYADNYKIALVERIGGESCLRLDLSKNMKDISIERDITDMVTKLYPYGKDDAHIGSVNSGKQYIISENADIYGVREGYRDYTDYIEPSKILRRARWEFDSENEERIDVPCVNITGGYSDISKLADYADEKINIGDTVTVIDCGNEIRERVIRREYYPYQSDDTVISVGRVKKDLFFYLEQIGTLAKRYKKVSTTGGKVKAKSVSGVISQSGMKINGENGTVSLLSDIIEVSTGGDVKTQIGNVNGQFVFNITDNNGNSAVNITDKGNMNFKGDFETEKLSVGDNVITQDSNGMLCINGKRILVEGE